MTKTLTLDAGVGRSNFGSSFGSSPVMTMDASAVSGGLAFLEGELEKVDTMLREPLSNTTYPRDIPIGNGGGWVETSSVFNVDYGVSGGQADGIGGVQNSVRRIQANMTKDIYKAIPYEIAMSIKYQDMQRGNVTPRSIEQIYDDGIRLDFDLFMNNLTYQGSTPYNIAGLVNDSSVTASSVVAGASTYTTWVNKTADEILNDVNSAIVTVWAACQYDNAAVPNHVLIPPANYAYIASTKVSSAGNVTILEFLLNNNIAKQKGVSLFIGESRYCVGTGSGGTNRMIVYRNEKRFISMDIFQALSRVMTQPNVVGASYDSLFMANVGQVKKFYLMAILYKDGI
jgi:hypothetical protein